MALNRLAAEVKPLCNLGVGEAEAQEIQDLGLSLRERATPFWSRAGSRAELAHKGGGSVGVVSGTELLEHGVGRPRLRRGDVSVTWLQDPRDLQAYLGNLERHAEFDVALERTPEVNQGGIVGCSAGDSTGSPFRSSRHERQRRRFRKVNQLRGRLPGAFEVVAPELKDNQCGQMSRLRCCFQPFHREQAFKLYCGYCHVVADEIRGHQHAQSIGMVLVAFQ